MNQEQIPIWDDPDVRAIFDFNDLQPRIDMSLIGEADQALIAGFVSADSRAQDQSPALDFVEACTAGVTAFECISAQAPVGFKKFLVHQVGLNTSMMWDRFHNERETRVFADWVMATLSANGWNPDGGATPLGQRATWNMAVAAQSGGGVCRNPSTGQVQVPDGEEARMVATTGSFEKLYSRESYREGEAAGNAARPKRRWFSRI